MADANATDLLMVFVDRNGTPIDGESTTVWDKADQTMMAGFEAGKVFELEDFSFGASLEDTENPDAQEETGAGTTGQTTSPEGGEPRRPAKKSKAKVTKFRGYVQDDKERKGSKYPVVLEEISLSRQLDTASVVLLDHCLNQVPLGAAALVRRKFTGRKDFHEAYLRLDFTEPLIVSVEWEDGDVIKEKLKMVCRGIKAVYRPQKPDGSLGDPIESSFYYETETV